MELTQDMIDGLNKMNVYAQRAKLGDIIAQLLQGGGGTGGGSTSLVEADSPDGFPDVGNEQNLYLDTTSNSIYRYDPDTGEYSMVGSSVDTIINEIEIIDGGNANG